MTALLSITGLVREYALPRASLFQPVRRLRVLHGIDLELNAGETLGVVGESGCGKSTLARAVLALERPQAGQVVLGGQDLFTLSPSALRAARRGVQAVFQDPYGSLDPRHQVGRIVAEPIAALERTSAADRRARVAAVLDAVGLPTAAADKYPHEFSGGQRQRVAIARALVTHPALIVADEPVSALDVSVQAQVLNLMMDLQERLGLAYLFISHDLGVVRCIADRVAVMYMGRVVEQGPVQTVFDTPRHPYTIALIEAVPRQGAPRTAAFSEVIAPPPKNGCPYAPRCARAAPRCWTERPELRPTGEGQLASCHFA